MPVRDPPRAKCVACARLVPLADVELRKLETGDREYMCKIVATCRPHWPPLKE